VEKETVQIIEGITGPRHGSNSGSPVIYLKHPAGNGHFETVSRNIISLCGYSADEFSQNPRLWYDVLDPADIENVTATHSHLCRTGQSTNCTFTMLHKNGTRVLIRDESEPVFDDKGQVVAITGKLTQIRALPQTPDISGLLDEKIKDIIFYLRLEPEFGFEYISRSCFELTGYTAAQFYNDPQLLIELTHPDEILDAVTLREKFIFGKENATIRWLHKDGAEIWVEISTRPVEHCDSIVAVEGIIRNVTAAKNAELKLRENERRLSTLLGNLPGMAYRCKNDSQWTMEFASSGSAELTGYTPEDFLQNKTASYDAIIHEDDKQKVRDAIEKALLSKTVFRITYRINCHNGQLKWVWEQGHGVYTPQGDVEAIEGFIADITHRKTAEADLKKSEEKYRTLVESSTEMIVTVNEHGTMLFANRRAAELFGISSDKLVGMKIQDFMTADDADDCIHDISLVVKSNRCLLKEKRKVLNGKETWLRVSMVPVKISADGTLGVMSIASDITLQKKTQEQLRESEEKFRNIVETSDDIVFQLSRSGTIKYVSPRITALYGWEPAELVDKPILNTTPPTEITRVSGAIRTLLKNNLLKNFEITQSDKFGHLIPMEINATPMHRNGKIVGIQGIMRNITERKHNEIELRRTNEVLKEHDRMKNEFVSTVSHELRTPLCIFKNILSNTMAQLYGPVAPKLRKNLAIANETIDRLARIINDFLDVSKIEAGKMLLNICDVDLQKLVSEVVEAFTPLAQSKDIHIAATMQNSPIIFEADRDKLVQILTNLFSNAVKFTPAGGNINILLSEYDQQITIAVSDTGIGIDEKDLANLFNRYVQVTKQITAPVPGTGLGLAIVKELVEMHQGKVWAQSSLGNGTTFTLLLPRKQA